AGIARVNYLMEFKDKIDFVGKEQIIGQARFLRAYYYFELVKYFGEVPLVIDQRLGADQVTKLDRSPTAEVYAQIEADLQYASATLPWSNPEKGRVDKGAALALLGKVHLYQNDFSVAAVILDSVIDFGGYALVEDYDALWLDANENNSETVFDIEYSGLEGGSYGCFVCLEGNAAAGFNGIRQYEGPLYGDGNSYNLPTADLYQAFDISDIRRDITILDLDAFIASQPNPSSISYAQGGGGHTGYYNNKYIKRQGEIGLPDNDLTSPLNYKVIRYADV
ncbi:MAG TPA: RagB/SusD family nutrient uptake outer membrane protein, partial [Cryomorphaceae bacterium]|nr:RagB/SusD family nutrient uptake outer membrane protein [Cryomorphaceae bacterium]